jgi:hypothetical protein
MASVLYCTVQGDDDDDDDDVFALQRHLPNDQRSLSFLLPQSQLLSIHTMAAVEAANGAFPWCTLALQQEHGSLV